MIDQIHLKTGHLIRPNCKVLGVPRRGYYHAALPTSTVVKDQAIGKQIEQIFRDCRRRYGYRRIYADLIEEGLLCFLWRVRRLMAKRGVKAVLTKNYVPRTIDGKADKPSPNRLLDAAMPIAPDTVWAGDITFISTTGGWLSLAVGTDLCSRRIVRWSIADNLRAELGEKAFQQAVKSRCPKPGLFFHSDRGSQFGSKVFRSQLEKAGVLQSMSAKATPLRQRLDGTDRREIDSRRLPERREQRVNLLLENSKPRCFRADASLMRTTLKPSSLPSSNPITIPAAGIPPWDTNHRSNSKLFFIHKNKPLRF